jgi:oligopeptide/dipeptide ABC transporter ATP-binding protein
MAHPYTFGLLSAVPIADPSLKRERRMLTGEVPSPSNPPSGCRFHPRCWKTTEKCSSAEPDLREIEPEHYVACHFPLTEERKG